MPNSFIVEITRYFALPLYCRWRLCCCVCVFTSKLRQYTCRWHLIFYRFVWLVRPRKLDLLYGNWEIAPTERTDRIFGTLEPIQVARIRRVAVHHRTVPIRRERPNIKVNMAYRLAFEWVQCSPQHIRTVGNRDAADGPRTRNRSEFAADPGDWRRTRRTCRRSRAHTNWPPGTPRTPSRPASIRRCRFWCESASWSAATTNYRWSGWEARKWYTRYDHQTTHKKMMMMCVCARTSKRYFRHGTSMPAMSARLANCALWWSLTNCKTGSTPSGQISTSSSSPAVSCTFCTYRGKHSATYAPKSVKLLRLTSSGLRTITVVGLNLKRGANEIMNALWWRCASGSMGPAMAERRRPAVYLQSLAVGGLASVAVLLVSDDSRRKTIGLHRFPAAHMYAAGDKRRTRDRDDRMKIQMLNGIDRARSLKLETCAVARKYLPVAVRRPKRRLVATFPKIDAIGAVCFLYAPTIRPAIFFSTRRWQIHKSMKKYLCNKQHLCGAERDHDDNVSAHANAVCVCGTRIFDDAEDRQMASMPSICSRFAGIWIECAGRWGV